MRKKGHSGAPLTFRSKGIRKKTKGGVSTVIGTLIFVLVLLLGFTTITTIYSYYSSYNSQLYQYDQTALQQQKTSAEISGLTFGANATTISTSTAALTAYIPITLTNSQTSATPSTFEDKIVFNPSTYSAMEAPDLSNIRFCLDAACATQLYSWLESCTPSRSTSATSASAWIKLASAIPANGGTLTIYMVFMPKSTDFDGVYWGEAPYLSGTYGQYDNGVNVFTFYDNFAGNSLNAKWSTVKYSSGVTITVNNGLTVSTTSTSSYGFVIAASTYTKPLVAETYTSSGDSILGEATSKSLNSFKAPYTGYSLSWYAGTDYVTYQPSGTPATITSINQTPFPSGIWQVTWYAKSTQYFEDGAGNIYSSTYSGATIANYRIYVGQSNGVMASSVFSWARMRAFPPNNVMPSASFGVTTKLGGTATSYSFDRKTLYSQGLWWAFYSDGANIGYSTSADGSVWTSETIVSSSSDSTDGFNFNLWMSGTRLYYVLDGTKQSASFYWRYGTLESTGFISWMIPETSVTTTNVVNSYNSIMTDSSGNVWVALNTNDGTNGHIEVWKYHSGAWSKQDDINPVVSDIVPILEPLSTGISLIYGEGGATAAVNVVTTITGASWSAPSSPASDYMLFSSSATAIGSTIYFVGLASASTGSTTGTVKFWSFTNGAAATSAETVLQSSTSSWITSISEEPTQTLIVFFGSGPTVSEEYSTNFGNAWSSPSTLSSSESSVVGLTSSFGGSGVIWTSGASSPFNVRFASIPVLTTSNNSPFTIHLISLYIYNTATATLIHFDTNSTGMGVTGSFDFQDGASEQISIPLAPFSWTTSQNYLITLATDQGVLISAPVVSPA